MSPNNNIAIGKSIESLGDSSIAIGDNITAEAGEVVVGETLFGHKIPEDLVNMVHNHPEGCRFLLERIFAALENMMTFGEQAKDAFKNEN